MISKSQIKLITSLQQKKYRDNTGLFIAEGEKIISEFIESGLKLQWLFFTKASESTSEAYFEITEVELNKISALKKAYTSLAVFEIPKKKEILDDGLIVALDAVRDPGNLGTIIRLCDWFGVSQLVCSQDTVDCYNPKVVQATMGSLARVSIHYVDLQGFLKNSELPVYGGIMNGTNVYQETLEMNAILVLGNEGKGISEKITAQLTRKITIPQYGVHNKTESLNVATATAILLNEFRRSTER